VFFKSLISVGLFLVLLSPPIWVGSWFAAERSAIRKEVRSQLLNGVKDADLVVLTFSKVEAETLLHWERDDEFEYKGKMFDVVRVKVNGNQVRYWCWPDEPESELNQKLRSISAQLFNHAPLPKHQVPKLVLFFKSLFFAENPILYLYPPKIGSLALYEGRILYRTPVLELWDTPPRAI
jgi:hypothetical protein